MNSENHNTFWNRFCFTSISPFVLTRVRSITLSHAGQFILRGSLRGILRGLDLQALAPQKAPHKEPSGRCRSRPRIVLRILRVGLKRKYSIIHNPFSSSLARRSAFCKSQDNLEISFKDTNGDLGIMSHMGHLRRTPELSQGNRLRYFF